MKKTKHNRVIKYSKILANLLNQKEPGTGTKYVNQLWATFCKNTTPGERRVFTFEKLIKQVLTGK